MSPLIYDRWVQKRHGVTVYSNGEYEAWVRESRLCRAKRPVRVGQMVTVEDVELPIDVDGEEVSRQSVPTGKRP